MENTVIRFGERIKNLRVSKKLSQEKLAELSCLHATYIGQIERGEKSPTIDTVFKLSKGLSLPVSAFFKNLEGENSQNAIADKIYNEILKLPQERQEKIYRILKEIMQFS